MRSLTSRLDRLARQNAHRYPVSPEQIAARVHSFDDEGFAVVFDQLLGDEAEKLGPEAFALWVSEFQRGIAAMMPGRGA